MQQPRDVPDEIKSKIGREREKKRLRFNAFLSASSSIVCLHDEDDDDDYDKCLHSGMSSLRSSQVHRRIYFFRFFFFIFRIFLKNSREQTLLSTSWTQLAVSK